jgi:hypothetical protein
MRSSWIWDYVSRAGGTNWICGSMNAAYGPDFRGLFLPDPWTSGVAPNDLRLQSYYSFIQEQVQEHTRSKTPLRIGDAIAFMGTMARSGLSPSTMAFGCSQLLREQVANVRWRRPAILDRLQLDLFRHVYKKIRPNLATFFSNSTAHCQHLYWRFMDPTPFSIRPSEKESRELANAIRWSYIEMDRVLEHIVSVAQPSDTIVFATALSQQPCLAYEMSGGKMFYRALDLPKLLEFARIDSRTCSAEPVMSEEFFLRFQHNVQAADACRTLVALRVSGRAAFKARQEGNAVFAGCAIFDALHTDAQLTGANGSIPFFQVMYGVETLKSGMHHPAGALWIRQPNRRHEEHRTAVRLECVAPTLLSLLGLPVPPELPGDALL